MKTWKHFIVLLVFLLFGCGSAPSSSVSTATIGMDLDVAIREAATQMEIGIQSGTMVALVSVASPSTAFSTQVLTRLESAIVGGRKLVVVDRANLDKIRAEQGFQLSGEVDDESAKSIGKLLGAGAIVTGSLTDLGDVYNLTLKAINIETATVAVSYLADLAKTTRIETLLDTGDGAASGGIAQASTARTRPAASAAPASPTTPAAPTRYTVTFNANGAGGRAPSAQAVQTGESITIPDIGEMANARGIFGGWNTRADGTGTPLTAGDTFTINANTQLYAQWIEKVFNINDRGPAGGIIFYDKGVFFDGWRYLEAAPADLSSSLWHDGLGRFSSVAGTGTAVGAGKQNTQAIVQHLGRERKGAAKLCSELVFGGYNDWFLPSKDELELMYTNLKQKGLGGFLNTIYWSSSHKNDGVWYQDFTNGKAGSIDSKSVGHAVRAIRQF
jgi:hypothetical protein